ncbi:hypothetical protein ACLED0_00160 [Lonsdalea quercina]|uniref:hypothetical protein n=1 Tax=Lonsdalea quercina TaxID=71657 RepID=UPI00397500CA
MQDLNSFCNGTELPSLFGGTLTLLSSLLLLWLIISYAWYNFKNKLSDEAVYHFTSAENFDKIEAEQSLRAARDGVIYATRNPKLSRVGSSKTKKTSSNPPVLVFRGDALKMFQRKNHFFKAFINGHHFYGVIFCEAVTREKGDVLILKSRRLLNALIIDEAVIKMPLGQRGKVIRYLSWITGFHKFLLPALHLGSITWIVSVVVKQTIPAYWLELYLIHFVAMLILIYSFSPLIMKLLKKEMK